MTATASIAPPGVGESQRRLLGELKRRGGATLAELETAVDVATETVRSHLRALVAQGLVERTGVVRAGAGRPRIRYRLSDAGEALFPSRDRELLRGLASFLVGSERGAVLEEFFAEQLRTRRAEAEARLANVPAEDRLQAVADLLSEQGFLAEIEHDASGRHLRLFHCPLRDLVEISHLPCRVELQLVEHLLGASLERESFIPDGAPSCTYAIRAARPPRPRGDIASQPRSLDS